MSQIVEINSEEELEKAIQENGQVLLDFWAPWCGPCRMIAPILDEIALEDNGMVVAKMNTDENINLANKLGIRSIPTLLKYIDGEVVDRQVGATNKEALLKGFEIKKGKS